MRWSSGEALVELWWSCGKALEELQWSCGSSPVDLWSGGDNIQKWVGYGAM
jgi:hypothetical protein